MNERDNNLVRYAAQEAAKAVLNELLDSCVMLTTQQTLKMLNCGRDKLKSLRLKNELNYEKGSSINSPIKYELNSLLKYKAKINGSYLK